ncbi:type I-MYXAN CRISPR-associated endonuclease Cas1 [Polyangium jinanense]|uniref:type I-MYXAN CRISPR-associated endonuclease Cas4/Cas1 n=1 Tax=Polyangium jinanense TaxID=2829994 RepID=UPI0023402BF1|nr:type I-MYXAN CRISPR-associated endonuclease Cas1 [Polyangium jinanense]MDC3952626.1 type I-MYXAN CRISPR-associated endonuclease Cas1 [Polyangium jinanense]
MDGSGDGAPLRVMALHALAYCERLFFLEEVEEIRVADERVYAGRTLHAELAREEGDGPSERFVLESEALGLRGEVDALRRRDGQWIPYEHKRGRCKRGEGKDAPEAWPSDRLQIGAYAMLVEEATGEVVPEGRLRYHADNVTVRIAVDDALRAEVRAAITRGRALRATVERPPVTSNERLCTHCSLAPVCLPEEERLAKDEAREPVHLAPKDDDRQALHVTTHGSRVGRSGDELVVTPREGEETRVSSRSTRHVVLHGGSQISTQALHLCAEREVGVSWVTTGGRFIGSLVAGAGAVQRRIRQYKALGEEAFALGLARRLVGAKLEGQLRFVLRSTRGEGARPVAVEEALDGMRRAIRGAHAAETVEELLGNEGAGAAAYFSSWRALLGEVDERLRYEGRTRRPPRDRVSALLGFGYALLLADVTTALATVGLEPALGFYHRPRSSAPPLSLDLMELFRVPLVDMAVMGSIRRGQWDPEDDFTVTGPRVWLSATGRRKLVEVYERRRSEEWKHSVVGYSLSYGRMIELEARLLEKEWCGAPGLFAKFRLR